MFLDIFHRIHCSVHVMCINNGYLVYLFCPVLSLMGIADLPCFIINGYSCFVMFYHVPSMKLYTSFSNEHAYAYGLYMPNTFRN